ncbi:hypothetical protein HY628_02345 [Candidatus Uhrbacteria bacterium]|nr:hypothetical protein [Candidatus Uhrbacteria bacterium]
MTNSYVRHAAKVGFFLILFYAVCLLWKFMITDPEVARFHLLSLKLSLPGFSGFTTGSIVWGGVLSFVYGFFASLVFHGVHGKCCLPKAS